MKKRQFEEFLAEQLEQKLSVTKLEIEQKFRVQDPGEIRRIVKQMGGKLEQSGIEHNELYDADRVLRKKKQILRLRYHGKEDGCLTFKGPRQKGHLKKRMEVETPVHFESAKRILELLGFRVFSTYRKHREEYALSSGKVCLDHLKNCGWFVEIEGSPREIRYIARRLGLEQSHKEERSYRKLFQEAAVLAAV